MRTFIIIWLGQIISIIGSGLTNFVLGVWIFEKTGEATPFVLIALFASLPTVLLSPIAGALVDRWNRRLVMIFSDVGSALTTLVVFILFSTGQLQVWHIIVRALFDSAFAAFQNPAYTSSVTLMVPKEQYSRSSAMIQTGQSISGIASPLIAGFLFAFIGVNGVILVYFATFFFAIGTLLFVHIPQPASSQPEQQGNTLRQDIVFGFRYLKERPGLFGLAVFIAMINLVISAVTVLSTPMILSFTDAKVLGSIQSVSSIGLFLGGVLVSAWGGTKRKMHGIYLGVLVSGLGLTFTGMRQTALWIGAGMFVFLFPITLVNASIRAITQTKIPLDLQGRIFSIIFMLARASVPVGYLLAGPLADMVFE
ncbi:MAG: MFS transporter, partial [Anaerolineales bacterium]